MGGMKWPQFELRTLLLAVAFVAVWISALVAAGAINFGIEEPSAQMGLLLTCGANDASAGLVPVRRLSLCNRTKKTKRGDSGRICDLRGHRYRNRHWLPIFGGSDLTAPRRRWSLFSSRSAFVVLIAIGCFAAIAVHALWPIAADAVRERERRDDVKKNLDQPRRCTEAVR